MTKSPYPCETCKNYEDDEGKSACNIREEWISKDVWNWIKVVGCASHSDFKTERNKTLDEVIKLFKDGLSALEELQVDGYSTQTIIAKRDVIEYFLEKIEWLRYEIKWRV